MFDTTQSPKLIFPFIIVAGFKRLGEFGEKRYRGGKEAGKCEMQYHMANGIQQF